MNLKTRTVWFAFCLAFPATLVFAALSPIEIWTYQAGQKIAESPKFYPNTFNPTHVVVVSQEGTISLVNSQGRPMWKVALGGQCMAPAGIGDLDGDGSAEIIVALREGEVVALDHNGVERWRYKMIGRISIYRCPMLVDLDGDNRCEVILTDDEGYVVCLSPSGRRLWQFRIDKYYASPTAAADLDRDGEVEIVYGTENNRVVCLTPRGTVKWIRNLEGKFARTAPSLGDLNGDGYLDIVVTMSFNSPRPKICALSGPTGEVLWKSQIEMWAYASNVIADLDQDGSPEVICCGRGRRVQVFNSDGSLRWKKISDSGGSYLEPAIADINGDGHYEIFVGSRFGPGIEVFSDQGTHLVSFGKEVCHVTPLIGDLNKDRKLDLITARINKGELVCYDLGAPARKSSVLWPTYRKHSANTGVGFYPKPAVQPFESEQPPANKLSVKPIKPFVWGSNQAAIEWPSSLPRRPLIEISVAPKRGASRTDVITLNLKDLPKTVPFELAYPGSNTVTWTLRDGKNGRLVSTYSIKIKISGKKSLANWMKPQLKELSDISTKILAQNPKAGLWLRQAQTAQAGTLSTISALAESAATQTDAEHDSLTHLIANFRSNLNRDAHLARTLAETADQGTLFPVLLWPDSNPWDDVPPWKTLTPPAVSGKTMLSTWMYRNEFEDVALNLLNITPEPLTLQIRADKDVFKHVDIREAIEVPRHDGSWVTDALPQLNSARTIVLAPGVTRQLWFVCNSKGQAAGTHEYPFELLALGHENWTWPVTIRANVANLDLATAPSFMRCNWSSPSRYRGAGLPDTLARSAVESGMNIIVGIAIPRRECDKQARLIGEPDWSAMDHDLSLLTPDCFLLINTIPLKTPRGVKVGDPVWSKAYRAWTDEVIAHLAAKGFPTSHWALYPLDEPGLYDGPRIQELIEKIKPIRAAAPNVPIYANPSGSVTQKNFRPLLPYIDAWSPELGALLRRPWMVNFFLSDGNAPVWCYEAPGGVKRLSPLGYYRSQALIAFSIGLQGAGYWTNFYSPHDLWRNLTDEGYGANYASAGIWVESRRWHATRDGTEDARAYRLLEKLTQEAQAKGLAKKVCDQAETLLKNDLRAALKRPMSVDDVTRHVVPYDPDFTELQSLRKRAAALTIRLQQALAQ